MRTTKTSTAAGIVAVATLLLVGGCAGSSRDADDLSELEARFRAPQADARASVAPLFWLHGDESPERIRSYLAKVAEGGNGAFVAESRPHEDWLGPGWFRDLEVCRDAAVELGLDMWIFDERWWPSGEAGGRVPMKYGGKVMQARSIDLDKMEGLPIDVEEDRLVAVIGGRISGNGIDAASLVDLTDQVRDGRLAWQIEGEGWAVMVFNWRPAGGSRTGYLVDGTSQEAVDWYLRTVYQPHYDAFADDFGTVIKGFFYDEPETHGDWGDGVLATLAERGIDWKTALVAWKFKLAGDDQYAARYQFHDAFAETWGRTLYGSIRDWCREHDVVSIGHFIEHGHRYLNKRFCAGNMFQLQKYSDMGGIDAVATQFEMGSAHARNRPVWQTPKLASSVSHAYGFESDLAMVEIFGARGQDLSYREMKWWADHMFASGVNFFVPHAFNPRAPADTDAPPYFYNGGHEPRWPLYRAFADYTARLGAVLQGGHHVCPVAFLYLGNSRHAGSSVTPEGMTTAIQDALYDCDWIPYEVFENDMEVRGDELRLREERYRVLVMPAADVVPYETMAKALEFYRGGGVVIGYGMLPGRSATLGRSKAEMEELRRAIWGEAAEPSVSVCETNEAGGRSYFLPKHTKWDELEFILTVDAKIPPALQVVAGRTAGSLHVLHRVKAGRDVFFVSNLDDQGSAESYRFQIDAEGVPEHWDPMRGTVSALPFERTEYGLAAVDLTLEPLESALIVFREKARRRPATDRSVMAGDGVWIEVPADPDQPPSAPADTVNADAGILTTSPSAAEPFQGVFEVETGLRTDSSRFVLVMDDVEGDAVAVELNGRALGGVIGRPLTLDLTDFVVDGANSLVIEPAAPGSVRVRVLHGGY